MCGRSAVDLKAERAIKVRLRSIAGSKNDRVKPMQITTILPMRAMRSVFCGVLQQDVGCRDVPLKNSSVGWEQNLLKAGINGF